MRRILNEYVFLITCLFVGFIIFAEGNPSPPGLPPGTIPPDFNCCDDLGPKNGEVQDAEAAAAYNACLANPAAYCTIPIDNSRYIYISIVVAATLASFVIFKAVKHKKTPM